MPTGPAFEDETEFEKELKSSEFHSLNRPTNPTQEAEDDEDEFDFGDSNSSAQGPDAGAIAVQRALERAAERAKEEEAAALTDALKKFIPVEVEPEAKDTSTPAAEEPVDIRKAAQAAMAEIANIYGSGLGDQEVLVMKSSASSATGDKKAVLESDAEEAVPVLPGGRFAVQAIEEGDEEAELQREEDEDALLRQEEERRHKERMKLEEEWRDLGSTATILSSGGNEVLTTNTMEYVKTSYSKAESYFRYS